MQNFVVKTKQVKGGSRGLKNRSNYVIDSNRKEHYDTTIVELRSFKKAQYYIEKNINTRREHRREKSLRGGGIQNYATEFSLNLPPNTNLSIEQWKDLTKNIVKEVARVNNLNPNDLYATCGSTIHKEAFKNEHCHLVLGNVVNNKETNVPKHIKGITQRHTTAAVKSVFTQYLKNELGLDPRTYKPKPENIGKNKPLWKARADKANEIYLETFKKSKGLKRLLEKFDNQLEKYNNAVVEKDLTQIKRQSNRLDKTIKEVEDIKPTVNKTISDNEKLKDILIEKKQQADKARARRLRPNPFETRLGKGPKPF